MAKLKAEAQALKSKVSRAAARLLQVPDDLLPEAEEALRKLKDELAGAEATIRIAEDDSSQDEKVGWLESWKVLSDEMVTLVEAIKHEWETPHPVELTDGEYREALAAKAKGKLKAGCPIFLGDKKVVLDGETDELYGWVKTHDWSIERPALKAHKAQLKALFHKLGLQVSVNWLPSGKRYWVLDFAKFSVNFDLPSSQFSEHQVDTSNNKRTHARTRDRG